MNETTHIDVVILIFMNEQCTLENQLSYPEKTCIKILEIYVQMMDFESIGKTVGKGPLLICSNGVGLEPSFGNISVHNMQTDFKSSCGTIEDMEKVIETASMFLKTYQYADMHKILETVYQTLFPDQPAVTLLGHSMGCQVALEFHRRNPSIVNALVLILGAAGQSLETFADSPYSKYVFRAVHRLMRRVGPKANHVTRFLLRSRLAWPFTQKMALVDPYYTSREDFAPYLSHIASMDILVFLAAAWECQLHNAWNTLDSIHMPTLIIAAEDDPFFPLSVMKKLHNSIAKSEFWFYRVEAMLPLLSNQKRLIIAWTGFFAERLGDVAPPPQKTK